MNKCNQSREEVQWIKNMEFQGYDLLSEGRTFGTIKDCEGTSFNNIPDAIGVHSLTHDLYIFDHKTCELNGKTSKRIADAARQRYQSKGCKGYSFMASWSNSFYQKDAIQRAYSKVFSGEVFYVVVTPEAVHWKKKWENHNRNVVNLTESETYLLAPLLREVRVSDKSFESHQVDEKGELRFDNLPEQANIEKIPVITPDGLSHILGYSVFGQEAANDSCVDALYRR